MTRAIIFKMVSIVLNHAERGNTWHNYEKERSISNLKRQNTFPNTLCLSDCLVPYIHISVCGVDRRRFWYVAPSRCSYVTGPQEDIW